MNATTKPDPIADCLQQAKTIAVVGFSAKPERPSHQVAVYLQRAGYKLIPVNPALAGQIWLGELCHASLSSSTAMQRIDIADCFRRPEDIPPLVDEAIALGIPCVWMQSGIRHASAAGRARQAGIFVVEDLCLKIEHLQRSQLWSDRRHA